MTKAYIIKHILSNKYLVEKSDRYVWKKGSVRVFSSYEEAYKVICEHEVSFCTIVETFV